MTRVQKACDVMEEAWRPPRCPRCLEDFTYDWCVDDTTAVNHYSQSCAKSH